jgi:tetratricopeptide (TPR) repeat protein
MALEQYEFVLKNDSNLGEAWINRGNTLIHLKRNLEALASFEQAISLNSNLPEAYAFRSNALNNLKRHEEALTSCDRAIELKPDHAEAWSNRGVALNNLKRHEEALISYNRSIELKPDHAEAWSNRGVALNNLKRHEEALTSYNRAITLKPDYSEAWSNRGVTLNNLKRFEEALTSYERAIDLRPDSAEAWSNRGNALSNLRRHEEALISHDRSIELKPDYADAFWNKSLHLLRLGNFDQGWQLYEWRWQYEKFASPPRNFPKPLWLGDKPIAGKTLLLHSEQGLGDSIQFCRYAKLVQKLGARVVLEVERSLVELFTNLEGVDRVLEKGRTPPYFDYHCPLLSLPLAFKTTVTTVPDDIPDLHLDKAKREQWGQLLSCSQDKPAIGIVWSGNPNHKNDHNRSVRLEDVCKVFSNKFRWFSLQKDVLKEECPLLRAAGVRDHAKRLKDLSDTAGLISHLDLVISVDTSVAHLAGALGRPVWVLLPYVPDFRWMWDREDSPWYPSMRLFRQPAEGDWNTVIARVGQELFRTFDV